MKCTLNILLVYNRDIFFKWKNRQHCVKQQKITMLNLCTCYVKTIRKKHNSRMLGFCN